MRRPRLRSHPADVILLPHRRIPERFAGTSTCARLAPALALLAAGRLAASDPGVSIAATGPFGPAVPADFAGLSFEMRQVLPGARGVHFFRASNRPLVELMRSLGVRNLRVGGNTADTPSVPIPDAADQDALFDFARAVGARVIYTLRLRQGRPAEAAALAARIMDRHGSELECFALGNEPDVYDRAFPAYVAEVRTYIAAVTAPDRAPAAVFSAPGTTPDMAAWARWIAQDAALDGRIRLITQHEYPGGNARLAKDPGSAREAMLSRAWVAGYAANWQAFVPAAKARGLPFRIEEINSYYNGGVKDASNTLAAGLWGLDYLDWWAAHGAAGLNFHTGDWVAAADALTPCWYAVFRSEPGGYRVEPLGYALKAFALAGGGHTAHARILSNASGVNLTAYALRRSDGGWSVTLIDKDDGRGARPVRVELRASGAGEGRYLLLTAPGGAAATAGLTIGGSPMGEDGSWSGRWTPLLPQGPGQYRLTLPPATAAVIRLAPAP